MSVISVCKQGDKEGLIDAIEKGGNVQEVDDKGRSCLHTAAAMGREDLVKVLLSYGANVMAKDNLGNTPLHCSGHHEIVHLLYEYGAELNARNNHGDTALKLMRRKGVAFSTLQLMEHLLLNDSNHIASHSRALLSQTKPSQPSQSIFMEFCKDLGSFYLVLLLVLLMLCSLFVAFLVTGYVGNEFSRLPVVDEETFQKTEL